MMMDRTRPRATLILLAAILSLVLAASSAWLASTLGVQHPEARLVLAGAVFFFGILLFQAVLDRQVGYLTIVCTLYLIFFFTIPGSFHSAMDRFPFYARSYAEPVTSRSSYIVLLFSLFLLLGHASLRSFGAPPSAKRWAASGKAPPATRQFHPVNFFSLLWCSWILLALSTAAIVLLGPGNFLVARSDFSAVVGETGTSGVLLALISVPRVFAFVALVCGLYLSFRSTQSGAWLVLFAAVIVNAFVNFPLALPRFVLFGFMLIAFAIFWRNRRPVRSKIIFVTAFVIGIFTVFPLVSFLTRGREDDTFQFGFLQYYAGHGDFDGFQSLINVVAYVSGAGMEHGRQLLSAVLAFIPRSVWPGKGEPTGAMAAEYMGYPYVNISAPLPAELFVDFGWIGIVVGAFIVGRYMCLADRLGVRAHAERDLFMLLRYGGIVGFAVIALRGSLLSVAAPIFVYFMSIEVLAQLCAGRSRRHSLVAPPIRHTSSATPRLS